SACCCSTAAAALLACSLAPLSPRLLFPPSASHSPCRSAPTARQTDCLRPPRLFLSAWPSAPLLPNCSCTRTIGKRAEAITRADSREDDTHHTRLSHSSRFTLERRQTNTCPPLKSAVGANSSVSARHG